MKRLIEKLIEKKDLTSAEIEEAVGLMLETENGEQSAAFFALLRAKGENAQELFGLVNALRKKAKKIKAPISTLDIVGTGGDGADTVNISTGAALIAALCGVPVIKHGNRAVSSRCGSADVLEALGFDIHSDPLENLREMNFGFCFAPDYHPALKTLKGMRKSLNIPTALNLVGPLLNPAGIDHLQLGVYQKEYVPLLAEALFRLGTKRSIVYSGSGIDELSCLGATEALLVTEEGITPITIDPAKLGLKKCELKDLKGGTAEENAKLLLSALRGDPSPILETLILNAGVAQFLYGTVPTIEEGIALTRQRLRSRSLKEAILKNPQAILAEIKRASPSKGFIRDIGDVEKRSFVYVESGASAISVLTDERFLGTILDLRNISRALCHTGVPILRKGFFEEKNEVLKTKLNGASAILLIVKNLKSKTKEMLLEAEKFGLEAIVEVHNEEELQIALDAGAEIIGVNQRDLNDFSMHPEIFSKLIGKIPTHVVKIAESGIDSEKESQRAFSLGYDAVLVGEALTRSEDPQAILSKMRCSYAS